MPKMTMSRVTILAHRADRKALLETLQYWGLLDIDAAAGQEDPPEDFFRPDTRKESASFERAAAVAGQALELLNEVNPASRGMLASLAGRREVTRQEFESTAAHSKDVLDIAYHILDLQKRRTEWEGEMSRLDAAMAQLQPWKGLDVPFRFAGTRSTAALIGALPMGMTQQELRAALLERAPEAAFEVEILASAPEQTCLFLLCSRRDQEILDQALRGMGFARPPATVGTSRQGVLPKDEYDRMQDARQKLQKQADAALAELKELAARRIELENTADYYTVRAEKYRVIGELGHTRHTFLITGYLPEKEFPAFRQRLEERFSLLIEARPADPEKAPVKLKNNAFADPAVTLTEMYAMPRAEDIDPTPVMSFFYYLFFGMMLSDAGYGILLVLGSWLLLKKYRPEPRMRRNLRLLMYCGISTAFWGLMFGSFFGDAVSVISSQFFGVEVALRPILFDPMDKPVPMLILSLCLGFAQILAGMGCKFYMQWRRGDRWGAVLDTGLWMTALLGAAILAAGLALLPFLITLGAVIGGVSLAGIVATAGRKKKGPMKVLSGVVSLYDTTSYMSDLMSYARLMALGLTTGVMSSVFNLLGTMLGGGVLGAVFMVLVFLVGHGINFGINALGSYVHSLRLQYVELFSKFYEGGGRPFRPFAADSRYTRFKEEP